jgi:hypothetical protein
MLADKVRSLPITGSSTGCLKSFPSACAKHSIA